MKKTNISRKKKQNLSNSDDPKKVIDSLKHLGKLKNDIPIIIDTSNGKIPSTTSESLNNLNRDYVQVGISDRSNDYNTGFINEKKIEVEMLIESMDCNSQNWNRQVDQYNITHEEIRKIISDYNITSPGPDGITIEFLKKTLEWSSKILQNVIILSLKEGYVPLQLRKANVTPIIKDSKKNKHTFQNFRPISVTSITSRILEKIIRDRIINQVDDKLPPYQYGGRSGMGTVDALAQVWTDILNNNLLYDETNVVFLDISKAFDRLIRELIVWKLKYICGISDPLVKWIHEFLNNRKQRVKVWGSTSNWMKTKLGGPQGSVLISLLFNLYMSDIPVDNMTDKLKTRSSKFVDDVSIYSTGEVHEQIIDLNEILKNIYEWSNQWGVDFNISKCKTISFSSKNRKPYNRTLYMGGKSVKVVNQYQYLGIIFDGNMTFNAQVDYILKKCKIESALLMKLCKNSNFGKRLFSNVFWKTKLRPIIEYGCEIWTSSISNDKFKEIQQYQVEYIRKTHKYGPKSCISAMMMDLSVVEIGLRIYSIKEKFLLKCLINKVSPRIQNCYNQKDILMKYSTKIVRNKNYPTGYLHVQEHDGRKKFKSTIKFPNQRPINFFSNYSRDAAKQRINWINKNIKTWYDNRKRIGSIFRINDFRTQVKTTKLIYPNEIRDCRELLNVIRNFGNT